MREHLIPRGGALVAALVLSGALAGAAPPGPASHQKPLILGAPPKGWSSARPPWLQPPGPGARPHIIMTPPQNENMTYGTVGGALLSDFGPKDLDAPCKLSDQNRLPEAASWFRRDLALHPDSLADFVGLAQADPRWAAHEDVKLRAALKRRPDDAISQFKLGVVEYYYWRVEPAMKDISRMEYAQSLVDGAWQKTRSPIVGAMAAEMRIIPTPYTARHRDMGLGVNAYLLAGLAGPRAYQLYLDAERKNWNAQAPPVNLSPTGNLRALRGIIRRVWLGAVGRIWSSQTVDGKTTYRSRTLNQHSEEWRHYLTAWMAEIDKVEGDS